MEELHSLDPRRQELLEARFTGAVTGNTVGSTGSTSGGAKVTAAHNKRWYFECTRHKCRSPRDRSCLPTDKQTSCIERISLSLGGFPPLCCICQQLIMNPSTMTSQRGVSIVGNRP